MLRDVIWTCFFTKLVCWQNLFVILEKSYLPHMSLFLDEIWNVDRSLSQESKKLSLHQMDFGSSRYSSRNGQRSTLADCEILTLKAMISMLFLFFIFLALDFQNVMDVSFLIPLESLHFDLCSSCSAQNIYWRSNLLITSNLLLFASFIQKCLQNIKERISRHFIYKT
jgi:hypothetical protein